MYKSRVFSFNEENLLRDMANYERDTGKLHIVSVRNINYIKVDFL